MEGRVQPALRVAHVSPVGVSVYDSDSGSVGGANDSTYDLAHECAYKLRTYGCAYGCAQRCAYGCADGGTYWCAHGGTHGCAFERAHGGTLGYA